MSREICCDGGIHVYAWDKAPAFAREILEQSWQIWRDDPESSGNVLDEYTGGHPPNRDVWCTPTVVIATPEGNDGFDIVDWFGNFWERLPLYWQVEHVSYRIILFWLE